MMERAINCCPLCGAPIEVGSLYQYSLNFRILKNGKMSKTCKKVDCGPMEVQIANCSMVCGAQWDEDDFRFDEAGHFIDLKYGEDG